MPRRECVVVIEDEDMIVRALVTRLDSAGYRVEWADRVEDGLDLVRSARPSCVVLDLRMPGLDGFDALRMLRDEYASDAPPVVVVSANPQEESMRRAFDLGAASFIAKPFRGDEVVREVGRAIHAFAAAKEVPR